MFLHRNQTISMTLLDMDIGSPCSCGRTSLQPYSVLVVNVRPVGVIFFPLRCGHIIINRRGLLFTSQTLQSAIIVVFHWAREYRNYQVE